MRPEQLAFFASDSRAPLQERAQARAELESIYRPTSSEMPSQADVAMIRDAVLEWQQEEQFAKAQQLQPTMGNVHRGPREPKSVLVDDMSGSLMAGGYWERPGSFGFEHCRLLVENTSLILGAIMRRDRQIKRFLRSYEKGRDLYYEVRKADTDTTGQGQRGREERALEQFIACSGWERRPHLMRDLGREPMKDTISKGVRDLLTYDAWAIETVSTRNGRMIDGFATIDAATVRLASEEGYDGDDKVIAIQLVNGIPRTTYTHHDLVYTMMNPRSDLRSGGYGYAPPEMIVRVVTGWLNAMSYNLAGFDRNSIPKGILTVVGSYDEKHKNAFKRAWNSMVKGVNNAWSLPVMFADNKDGGATFERFGADFNEMYFAKWMTWLTAIIALVYGMDPVELNSESFSSGHSSLSGSDRAEALADARDTGLEPLLTHIEDVYTTHLLGRIDPDFAMRFNGIRPVDTAWQHEAAKLVMSVKQMKEREGIELTGEAWENAPLNPSLQSIYLQQLQAEQAAQQQQAQAAGEGAPGQPGDQPSEPGSDQGQGQDQQAGQPVATDSGPEDAQRDQAQ
ncbi:MAG: phage portal protein [Nitrospira sp.]|nr:phage portal protein [Nitrospira sp.]